MAKGKWKPLSQEYRQYNETIKNIDDEFRLDLSLHLYSAYLLRENNLGRWPLRRWDDWPKPLEEVVDPKTVTKYVDEKNPLRKQGARMGHRSTKRSNNDNLSADQKRQKVSSDQNDGSEDDVDSEEMEELSSPSEGLKIELDAAFQRQIYSSIKDYALKFPPSLRQKIVPRVEPPIQLNETQKDKIIEKLDYFVQRHIFNRIRIPAAIKKEKAYTIKEPVLNWLDVLSLIPNATVYHKCQQLFKEEPRFHIAPKYRMPLLPPTDIPALDEPSEPLKAPDTPKTSEKPDALDVSDQDDSEFESAEETLQPEQSAQEEQPFLYLDSKDATRFYRAYVAPYQRAMEGLLERHLYEETIDWTKYRKVYSYTEPVFSTSLNDDEIEKTYKFEP